MMDIRKSIEKLKELPYLQKPYSSRLWGHSLHSLCSYQSKLKPAIAYFLAKLFVEEGDLVFEPFAGVGTIPFEIAQRGIKTVSLDLSSVAYVVTYAKMNPIKKESALKQLMELNSFIKTSTLTEKELEYADEYIKNFYQVNTLKEILKAKKFFESKDENYYFLKACLLHILHGNRPYALSRRSHNITPYSPRGDFIYKDVVNSLRQKINRMYKEPLSYKFERGEVFNDSLFHFQYPKKFDKIITSPPFVNSTRFVYNNRIRMWFNGESYTQQKRNAEKYIENENIKIFKKVLTKFSSLLKDKGLCIMHLGVVKKLDMGKELSLYAEEDGFEVLDLVYENVKNREKFGIRDQGATNHHQFLILRKR